MPAPAVFWEALQRLLYLQRQHKMAWVLKLPVRPRTASNDPLDGDQASTAGSPARSPRRPQALALAAEEGALLLLHLLLPALRHQLLSRCWVRTTLGRDVHLPSRAAGAASNEREATQRALPHGHHALAFQREWHPSVEGPVDRSILLHCLVYPAK